MRRVVVCALPFLLLAASCTLEVAPEYTRPFVGQVDAASGTWWLPDGGETDAPDVDEGFVVASLLPTSGVPEGGDKVVLEGHDFRQTDRVLFGDIEASEVRFQGPERLVAFTPPHVAGRVRVVVRHQEGDQAVAPRSFLFTREPVLVSVSPSRVDAEGGQPVRFSFQALDPDARVLVGDRLLAAPRRVDASTITGVLPPLAAGTSDVLVVTPGKAYRFEGAVLAIRVPRVERAEPMLVSSAAGGDVALVGSGLAPTARVFVDGAEVLVLGGRADGTRLRVRLPAGADGALRVEVVAEGGLDVADGAIVRTSSATPTLAGVFPPRGPAAGGTVLALAPIGLDSAAVERATVCGVEAPILARPPGLVLVSAPAIEAGPCDVSVEGAGLVLLREGAYAVEVVAVRLDAVEPVEGPSSGGTRLRLAGTFADGLDDASLCGLPLGDLRRDGDGAWSGLTPEASPGDCPVIAVVGGHPVDTGASFRFLAGSTELLAVADDEGSRAGGTLVRVLGTDLPAEPEVLFDRRPAEVVRALPNAVLVRTPAVEGPYPSDVVLTDGVHAALLPEGYAYLDLATDGTGTWGGPVRGAVNVTVLHSSTRDPVPDALLSLRRDDGSWLHAHTDEKGQAVLSEEGLAGPVTITASREGFSAYTIVDFDARNVTLGVLGPVPPPPTDGEPSVEPLFKPASVSGTVYGIDKYVPPPFRACTPEDDDGVCHPCAADVDCSGILRCVDVGSFGSSCLVPCSPFDEPCPAGFGCYPGPDDTSLCYPVLGQRRVYCFASSEGAGGMPVTVDQGSLVQPGDVFLLTGVRLGELAVICLAGYEDDLTHAFQAQTLGASRHLFTVSDTLQSGVDVFLDTPLAESPAFELTGYVDRPGAFQAVTAWATLDLGSDGALALPDYGRAVDARHVVFPRVPLRFDGTFYDATLDFEVHADRGGSAYAPYTEAYRFDFAGFRQDRTYAFEGTKPVERPLSLPLNFTSLARDDAGELLAATDDGRVLRQRWGTWYAEPVAGRPIVRSLAAAAGRVVGVGDEGVLVLRDAGAWRPPIAVADRALFGVAVDESSRLLAVGDERLLEGPVDALLTSKVPDHLRAAAFATDGTAWAVGQGGVTYVRQGTDWRRFVLDPFDDLRAIAPAPDGVWTAGSSGRVFQVRADGTSDVIGELGGPVASLLPTPGGLLAGLQGGVARWDGQAWVRTALASDFLVTGMAAEADLPTLVVGAMRLELGPLLPPPEFLRPERDGTWTGRTLTWSFPGGTPAGDYQIVTLFDYFGTLAWTVLLDGTVTEHALAPLDAWGEADPLDRPAMRLQYARVLAQGFDFNETNGYSGGYRTRDSVLYDYFEFLRR